MRGQSKLTSIPAATVLVMTALILLVRKDVRGAPCRQISSVLFSVASFVGVLFFLQNQSDATRLTLNGH